MKWLEKVAKDHKGYVNMVKGLGESFYAEDIVQEFYIKLFKYGNPEKVIKQDGELNNSFLYTMLKNIFINFQIEKAKVKKIDINQIQIGVSDQYLSKDEARNNIDKKIDQEIKTWHYFDSKLFKIYRDSGLSMRQISKGSGISVKTIFYTIKKCKDRLREELGEDYEDYENEDYELI